MRVGAKAGINVDDAGFGEPGAGKAGEGQKRRKKGGMTHPAFFVFRYA